MAEPKPADRTTLWGTFGIVFACCCVPLGPVFAVLSYRDAKRFGRRPTLAYVGAVLSVAVLAVYGYLLAVGRLDFSSLG